MADVLVIDNFDSFTFNLVDAIARAGHRTIVRRNTLSAADALRLLDDLERARLVLSPGPGHPREAGCCVELAARTTAPLLGICLGHQALVEAFGGRVGHASEVVHGKASAVYHDSDGLFAALPSPMPVARYHSLAAQALGDELVACAALADGTCMAVRHRERPLYGLQFHPESILTPAGDAIVRRFMEMDHGA